MNKKHIEIAVTILQNANGLFFVHQRSDRKKFFPSLYGLGAGGQVEQGETSQKAVQRELKEELGIDAVPKFLFTFQVESKTADNTTALTMHYFHVVSDVEPKTCDEFQWTGWMNKEEVNKLATSGKMTPGAKTAWEKFKLLL
ncbi:MAG: NUDIX domain-containing protein [Candidatus Micrarchaeota archaeon]